jgi:hypothetical protein
MSPAIPYGFRVCPDCIQKVTEGATLTVTVTGRRSARVTSSPAGINVTTGNTGSASFTNWNIDKTQQHT